MVEDGWAWLRLVMSILVAPCLKSCRTSKFGSLV